MTSSKYTKYSRSDISRIYYHDIYFILHFSAVTIFHIMLYIAKILEKIMADIAITYSVAWTNILK